MPFQIRYSAKIDLLWMDGWCISMYSQLSPEIPGFLAVISALQSPAWRKRASGVDELAPPGGTDSTHRRPRGGDTAHAAAGSSCVLL